MTPRRDLVVAAGAVVWRAGSASVETFLSSAQKRASVEICLVHRPRYDDWSLPKGKLDQGENLLACAAREVFEETGHRVVLGRPLPPQQYTVAGRPKRVHYWLAEADAAAGPREPDDEIDEVVFLPAAAALDRLTYRRDAELVRKALSGPLRTTPLVLLRHAAAVARGAWPGPDVERPLSRQGAADLRSLTEALNAVGVRRVISSDSVRCVDTVRPLAQRLRIMIELEPRLSEESLRGSDGPHPAVRIVRSLLTDGPALICSHRPLLPALFEAAGADPGRTLEPAEFVVLHHRDGLVVANDRHGPRRT